MQLPSWAEIGGMTDDELRDLDGELDWELKALRHKMDDASNYPTEKDWTAAEREDYSLETTLAFVRSNMTRRGLIRGEGK